MKLDRLRSQLTLCLAMSFWLSSGSLTKAQNTLPPESEQLPLAVPHFPDVLHTVVWRNWQIVPVERLAEILQTTPDRVTQIAESMGLPAEVRVPPEFEKRGYITLLRRNWHLLPFEQLVPLLNMSAEELALRLREDDFLLLKLGRVKPKCPPVIYETPSAAAQARAAEIKELVNRQFGNQLKERGEARFHFIKHLSATTAAPTGHGAAKNEQGLRYIYSYFAMFGDPLIDPTLDPYPDGLLERLRDHGVNGVWLHVVLRQLAPGGEFPEFGEGHEERIKNLRELVRRAEKYGIKVYLYMNEPRAMPAAFFKGRPEMKGVPDNGYFAMCTSNPTVRKWLSDSLAYVFGEVPGLGGVFTISASENLTNCSSAHTHHECERCRDRTPTDILVEVNTTIAEGVHRSAPDAKVIVWDWGWGRHGDASETIAKLPKSVWFTSVSEWNLPIVRGGIHSRIVEYSMSAVGPGPRALQHWQVARDRGLKTAAKVQFNLTWELSSVPYLPVMDLVAEHNGRLAEQKLDGLMLSWSLGGYPSLNLELARRISQNPGTPKEEILDQIAQDAFGKNASQGVRSAWTKFSRAFAEYPYGGGGLYSGPQHQGPANLLHEKPTGMTPGMVCFPYDALTAWCGPYPPDIFENQFRKVATGWDEGLKDLESVQGQVDEPHRAFAKADLRVAQAAQLHFASVANQVAFTRSRNALVAEMDATEKQKLCDIIQEALNDELRLAQELFDLVQVDSRIGYEASNHYYYVPLDLVEKVVNCTYLQKQFQKAQ